MSRHARSGPRRQVTWIGPALQNYVAVANGVNLIVGSFDPASSALPKPTIVRTRGQISVAPDLSSADVDIIGAFGMCVVSDQALAAGSASIPAPFSQADWDGWFVWRSFSMRYEFIDGTGTLQMDQRFEIDSKAMRKVSDNESIVLMAQSQGGAFDISAPIRMLLKLS